MYCPHCGVNNDRGEGECFICHKPLPNLNALAAPAGRSRAAAAVRTTDGSVLVYGSVGDRMLALLFDRIVIAAILLVVGAVISDRYRGYTFTSLTTGALAIGGTLFVVTFLYHFISEAAFLTTVGKAAMGLHVGIEDGGGRLAGAALRNLLRIVDGQGLYFVAFLFATFSRRRKRIGDMIGRTVVLEWGVPRGARAAAMFLIIVIIAAAVWIASTLCPSCADMIRPIKALGPRP